MLRVLSKGVKGEWEGYRIEVDRELSRGKRGGGEIGRGAGKGRVVGKGWEGCWDWEVGWWDWCWM